MVSKKMTPPAEITENIFAMSAEARAEKGIVSLPGNLKEALDEMKKDPLIKEVLGDHVYSQYIAGKTAEWDSYRTSVSEWERKHYMIAY